MTNLDMARNIRDAWRYRLILARTVSDNNPSKLRELLEQVYELTLDLHAFCRINNIDLPSLFEEEIIPEVGLETWPSEYNGFVMTLQNDSKDNAIEGLKGYCEKTNLPIPIEL